MKTKNIFQALALAMLLPVMLLATACSNINDDEITDKNGYTLPVTVNVTRQSEDPATKATYNETTKMLEFSMGDQLFVQGNDEREGGAGRFAGTLTWTSGGTFSGTITTQKEYTGTFDALFSASSAGAILLPAGYDNPRYLSISNSGTYSAQITLFASYAFVTSTTEKTAKALAVEQFNLEIGTYSSGIGFALSPSNAILSFTITGLTPSTNVTAKLKTGSLTIRGEVTTDADGTATFAMAVIRGININQLTLTVGGNDITFSSSDKKLEAGHIYNITRTVLNLISPEVGQVIGSDGKNHTYNSSVPNNGLPAGVTPVARICYVDGTGHGLALALTDEGEMVWSTAKTTCTAHTPAFSSGTWKLATQEEWNKMINVAGGTALRDSFEGVGGNNIASRSYWSSTEYSSGSDFVQIYNFYHCGWGSSTKGGQVSVRACLAF
jgi:hypothetical protein